MFNTPLTTTIPNNDDAPKGYHYWGTEPKLNNDGTATIPLRPNSNETRSQAY